MLEVNIVSEDSKSFSVMQLIIFMWSILSEGFHKGSSYKRV